MLTLKRFRTLFESYGAEPRQWPEDARLEAEALLGSSPQARRLLAEARELDDEIGLATAWEDAQLWRPGEQDAALARLRSSVGGLIASAAHRRQARPRFAWAPVAGTQWALSPRRWTGMAACGFLVAAGILVGSSYQVAPPANDLLALLQPAPIHFLAD